jgi:hypothetical protein
MAKDDPAGDSLDEAREDDGQIYVDRDKIDFDPDDGLLSGTAIDGTSDIPDTEGGDTGNEAKGEGDEPTEGEPAQ